MPATTLSVILMVMLTLTAPVEAKRAAECSGTGYEIDANIRSSVDELRVAGARLEARAAFGHVLPLRD